jgi:MerR family transcriptional regulator/heat shock protein HspR
MKDRNHPPENEPLYVISVASRLAGVHPQTLRLYERIGIIKPSRSQGNVRLYSQKDIRLTREARRVIKQYGVNLSGVKFILELEEEVAKLRQKVTELENELNLLRAQTNPPLDK